MHTPPQKSLKKGTILLVEDQPEHIDVVKAALDAHFTVKIATHGELGLRLAKHPPIDLILLDIMMPGMDGFEVCRQLKADPATAEIPVVFLTAKQNYDDETYGLSLGAMDFIRKPSNPAVILARVTNLVELHRVKKELLQRNEELLHTLHIREDMDNLARHDLKGPLVGILGLPELLLADRNLSEEQRTMIQVIETNGFTMLEMINRSLDLYKMESGQYPLQREQFDLLGVLKRVVLDLQRHTSTLHIQIHTPQSESPLLVCGERLLCYSLFHNLLLNAVQAAGNYQNVTVQLLQTQTEIRIIIRNPGEVPIAIRERFFEKYVTAGKQGGTGLGTYSAWLAAKTQGGSIALDCQQAGETTIIVTLPRADTELLQHSGGCQ
ncbi:hybrid sensor histidine kinase/response regulator [Candidatus Magnetaquicoccus inordinatus]|uniref:hybrid sensor histidine kinase/response regulator n=1 Tax=Candidatus Magnetaquicoccus inordinatus TaxID=2496818 RepID=UPI00102C6663|nr:hybrid sensor histidine kinase/response regulator [Candidatus Magnetaquicoccus inordinatus]